MNDSASSFKIMSTDDDDDFFMLMESIIKRKMNIQDLERAIDGEDLIQRLEQCYDINPSTCKCWPDVIFLDINMPRKNGFQVLEEIRSNPRFPRIPIIMLTVSANEEDVTRCLQLGADGFITKPTDIEELINALKNAIEGLR